MVPYKDWTSGSAYLVLSPRIKVKCKSGNAYTLKKNILHPKQ